MYNKTIIEFGFRMISRIIKTSCLYYLLQPSASADNTDLGFDNSCSTSSNNCLIYRLGRAKSEALDNIDSSFKQNIKSCNAKRRTKAAP